MKSHGKIRLLVRPHDECRAKKCSKDHFCYVIDTYNGATSKYIGSWYIHVQEGSEVRKIMRRERARWRREGFTVVR